MLFSLHPYNLQELGHRPNQEDALYPEVGKSTPDDRLFILCDGMGGHEKGEVASNTVCEVMSQFILQRWNPTMSLSDTLLKDALNEAFDALDAKDSGGIKKMGTTLTFLCFHSDGVKAAHIGDSRIYQLRPKKGNEPAKILFRTKDHSLVNDLLAIGEITEEEAESHPQKNVITRCIQPGQDPRVNADIMHLTDVREGDYFYMCSDGMLEETDDDNLLNIITKPNTDDVRKLEMLREVTEDNSDNHTAHLIKVEKVTGAIRPMPVTPPPPVHSQSKGKQVVLFEEKSVVEEVLDFLSKNVKYLVVFTGVLLLLCLCLVFKEGLSSCKEKRNTQINELVVPNQQKITPKPEQRPNGSDSHKPNFKTLGQGSFGITYLAEHTALAKKVAIKEFFMKNINERSSDGCITGMTDLHHRGKLR